MDGQTMHLLHNIFLVRHYQYKNHSMVVARSKKKKKKSTSHVLYLVCYVSKMEDTLTYINNKVYLNREILESCFVVSLQINWIS